MNITTCEYRCENCGAVGVSTFLHNEIETNFGMCPECSHVNSAEITAVLPKAKTKGEKMWIVFCDTPLGRSYMTKREGAEQGHYRTADSAAAELFCYDDAREIAGKVVAGFGEIKEVAR